VRTKGNPGFFGNLRHSLYVLLYYFQIDQNARRW
jgi:hypothetical protein